VCKRLFSITVCTSPSRDLTLAGDVRLVKAALLYADSVTLCSLGAHLILTVASFMELAVEQKVEFLASVAPAELREREPAEQIYLS
jgi:hypothetical protein